MSAKPRLTCVGENGFLKFYVKFYSFVNLYFVFDKLAILGAHGHSGLRLLNMGK